MLSSAVTSKSRSLLDSTGSRSLTNMSQPHQNQCFSSSSIFSVSSHSAFLPCPSSLSHLDITHGEEQSLLTRLTRTTANVTDLSACTSRGPAEEPAWGRAPCMSRTPGTSHLPTRPRTEKCAPKVFYRRPSGPELCLYFSNTTHAYSHEEHLWRYGRKRRTQKQVSCKTQR